jgi:two-component system cell cycle sensor histidine kinase/response regulator CckA
MNKLKTQNRLLFTITVIVYIIALFVYGLWDYTYRKNETIESIDTNLYNSAAALKYILPEDFHDRAIDEQAISIKQDKYIAHKLTKLIKETGFKYTYTIVKKGGKLFFIASDITADPKNKRGTFYFYPYEEADESFFKAFGQDTPTYKTVSDQWGTVRTVMVPEKSPGGINYLACADYDISYVNGLLQKNFLRSIATVLFFLLLSVPIIITYTKSLSRHLDSLRKSEEQYRNIYETSPDVIFATDLEGTILITNPRSKDVVDYTPEELIGKNVSIFYKDIKDRIPFVNALKAHEFVKDYELTFATKNGEDVHVSLNASLVFGEDGNPIRIEGTIRDVTDRKRAEKELRESEEKLARAKKMEALGLLAGGVAHDLNNVLSGIVSYPELLLLDLHEDSMFRKPIETMQESGHRAAAIVQDLLTVARGVATTKEPLNLNDLIGDYLNSPEFKKLEHFYPAVTVKTNPDRDLFNVSGSHVHIRKVVMNLVSNASEAIEGGGNVTISTMNRYIDRPLRGYDDVNIGEYAVLAVSDDGSGISSDDLERIFEPFYTTKVMGRSGTGLGLALVWNVVQDHKGYLDVTTDENGTTFELYFPITREAISGQDLSIPIKDYKGDGETVLVVDDVKSQREISCEMLNTLGYKTKAVSSGEEAVEYLKENTVDLILLDMIMDPGINGRETYERIIKIHPNQKAIIVSGFAETDDVKGAQKSGAGQYIKKPLTLKEIGIAVRNELKK